MPSRYFSRSARPLTITGRQIRPKICRNRACLAEFSLDLHSRASVDYALHPHSQTGKCDIHEENAMHSPLDRRLWTWILSAAFGAAAITAAVAQDIPSPKGGTAPASGAAHAAASPPSFAPSSGALGDLSLDPPNSPGGSILPATPAPSSSVVGPSATQVPTGGGAPPPADKVPASPTRGSNNDSRFPGGEPSDAAPDAGRGRSAIECSGVQRAAKNRG